MTITEKSNKAEIITESLDIIDTQASQINKLQQQQRTLFGVLGFLFITSVLF